MYVCWQCWHAEMKFKRGIFFQVLVEIFSTKFSTQDEVSRKIVKKLKKAQEKKPA